MISFPLLFSPSSMNSTAGIPAATLDACGPSAAFTTRYLPSSLRRLTLPFPPPRAAHPPSAAAGLEGAARLWQDSLHELRRLQAEVRRRRLHLLREEAGERDQEEEGRQLGLDGAHGGEDPPGSSESR